MGPNSYFRRACIKMAHQVKEDRGSREMGNGDLICAILCISGFLLTLCFAILVGSAYQSFAIGLITAIFTGLIIGFLIYGVIAYFESIENESL